MPDSEVPALPDDFGVDDAASAAYEFKTSADLVARGFDVQALAEVLREKFDGIYVQAPKPDPRDPPPQDGLRSYMYTHVYFSRPFEGGRLANQRGIRNLAARVRRFIERYAPQVGYVVAEANTYCEAAAEPPSAQIFLTLVHAHVAEKYSRRERSKKNWWARPPVDHGPQ